MFIEAYFLFDVVADEASRTEYDKLGESFKEIHDDVDEVHIYVFRDRIAYFDLANLVNSRSDMNADGFVSVHPLQEFFDNMFGLDE